MITIEQLPPCWPYVELKKETQAIRELMEERKDTNEKALALARELLEKKLEEMNGIKKEVLAQAKEAATRRGEHKWSDIITGVLITAIISGIVSGIIAYLVSRGGP